MGKKRMNKMAVRPQTVCLSGDLTQVADLGQLSRAHTYTKRDELEQKEDVKILKLKLWHTNQRWTSWIRRTIY